MHPYKGLYPFSKNDDVYVWKLKDVHDVSGKKPSLEI